MTEVKIELDQETFITSLALNILEGRSFDVTGKSVPFDKLLFPDSPEPPKLPLKRTATDEQEEDEQDDDNDNDNSGDEEEDEAGTSSDNRKFNDRFIINMMRTIDERYQMLLSVEQNRISCFRTRKNHQGLSDEEQLELYRNETHLDEKCKLMVENIQKLQKKYKSVAKLQEVTQNLEKLSQMVNFDSVG